MEKFYFKSYNRTIGSASNLEELKSEMKRLSKEDPASLEYQLKEGHITAWLNYIGETAAAQSLAGVSNVKMALQKLGVQEEGENRGNGMHGMKGMHGNNQHSHGGRGMSGKTGKGMQ